MSINFHIEMTVFFLCLLLVVVIWGCCSRFHFRSDMKSTEVEFYCAKGKFMVIENNSIVLRWKLKTKVVPKTVYFKV